MAQVPVSVGARRPHRMLPAVAHYRRYRSPSTTAACLSRGHCRAAGRATAGQFRIEGVARRTIDEIDRIGARRERRVGLAHDNRAIGPHGLDQPFVFIGRRSLYISEPYVERKPRLRSRPSHRSQTVEAPSGSPSTPPLPRLAPRCAASKRSATTAFTAGFISSIRF